MGSYSAEAISTGATNINEFKLGLNAAIFAEEWLDMATGEPSTVQSWPAIDAWLDRSDAVGASVLFPLTLPVYMMFTNTSCCDDIITAAVKRVARHRCVVGWYLADEPDQAIAKGTATRVAAVKAAYDLVKSLDSRPIMSCFDSTPPFSNPKDVHNFPDFLPFTDVAAADIYPVAHHMPVQSQVAPGISLLRNHTEKPIIFVAQSFGGREVYTREPSAQEERIMVYLAWIHGASGVLYFEHEDAPAYFGQPNQHLRSPASTNLWKECTRMAMEGMELTPALLSDRSAAPKITSLEVTLEGEQLTAAPSSSKNKPSPSSSSNGVYAVALVEQRLGGGVVLLVANTNARPANVTIILGPGSVADGPAPVLFSARNISVTSGVIIDWVDAMGTRAFRLLPVAPLPTASPWTTGPTPTPNLRNVLFNPSFEQAAGGVGGGLPDGFTSAVRNDSASASFSDPRDSVHGLHSLRIHTPSEGNGQIFTHFMCPTTAMIPDTEYELSVWARGKTFHAASSAVSGATAAVGPTLLLGLQGSHMASLILTDEWTRYNTTVRSIPATDHNGKTRSCWTNQGDKVSWQLNTTGVAWIDLLELVPKGGGSQLVEAGISYYTDRTDMHAVVAPDHHEGAFVEVGTGDKAAPVHDSLGLPLSPIGFFTHELGLVNRTVPISTQRAGMTSGFIYLPHGDLDLDVVNTWLDRCDAVGTSVLLDVRFDATIFGSRGGPKPAVVQKALAATKAKVAALMHHESVFAWYIADEPDGAHWVRKTLNELVIHYPMNYETYTGFRGVT
jgi:hypothetical protein